MDLKQLVVLILQIAVIGTTFGYGLKAERADLTYLTARPGLLLRSLLAVLVVVPLLMVLLVEVLDLPVAVEATVLALAISPVPPLLPKKQSKAGGTASYALGLLVSLAVAAVVVIPLLLIVLSHIFGRPLALSPWHVGRIVAMTVLVPLAAGLAVKAFAPALAARLQPAIALASTALLALGALALLAGTFNLVWQQIGGGAIVAIVALVLVGLAVGHLLGGRNHGSDLALACACRHPAIALTILAANHLAERPVAMIVLYMLVSAVVCVPYVAWRRRGAMRSQAGWCELRSDFRAFRVDRIGHLELSGIVLLREDGKSYRDYPMRLARKEPQA